jgi:hypothetical protein
LRPCSAALQAFLEGPAREAILIDLYTVRLVTGETFRWSGGNQPVSVPAAGFPANSINAGAGWLFELGPGFGRSTVTTKIGVEASELDVQVYSGGDVVGAYSLAEIARAGLLDGATVELDKLFAPPIAGSSALDTSLGVIVWFRGRVADVEIGRSVVRVKVKGVLDRLSTTQFPRRLYASSCSHVFGAPMCGYNRVAGTNALGEATGWGAVDIAALAGSTQSVIISAYVPALDPSPYIEGTITSLSGGNTGVFRTIRYHDLGYVYAALPFVAPVVAGDVFQILPGCSHSTAMCEQVFDNIDRYGGFPDIPPPEGAI